MWSLFRPCCILLPGCHPKVGQSMARLFLYHTCIIFVPSFPGQSGHIWYCKQSFASCHDLVRLDAVRKRFDKGSGKMMGIWWEEVFKLLPCHYNVPIMSHNAPHLYPFIFHYSPSPMFILCLSMFIFWSYFIFTCSPFDIIMISFLYHFGEFCWGIQNAVLWRCCDEVHENWFGIVGFEQLARELPTPSTRWLQFFAKPLIFSVMMSIMCRVGAWEDGGQCHIGLEVSKRWAYIFWWEVPCANRGDRTFLADIGFLGETSVAIDQGREISTCRFLENETLLPSLRTK